MTLAVECDIKQINLNPKSLFLILQETISVAASTAASTAATTAEISDTDRRSFGKKIRSLLMEVIKTRKEVLAVGKTKYVGALNSYVKSLAKLMKVVKESIFDKEKVGNILTAIKKRVTLITAELEGRVTTVTIIAANGTATSVPMSKVCNYSFD